MDCTMQNPTKEILIDTENFALKQNIMRIAPLMISRLEKKGKIVPQVLATGSWATIDGHN